MAPSTALDKAVKAEVETLTGLELKFTGAQKALQRQEQGSPLSERSVETLLNSLEDAIKTYESSIAGIIAVSAEEEEAKRPYLDKLAEWMAKVDPVLDQLHANLKTHRVASNPPEPLGDASNRTKLVIQMKIKLAHTQIESRLNLINTAEREEEVRTSLPKIWAYLRQLDDVQLTAKTMRNTIYEQLATGHLNDIDADALQTEATGLTEFSSDTIATSKARFNVLAVELAGPESQENPTVTVQT